MNSIIISYHQMMILSLGFLGKGGVYMHYERLKTLRKEAKMTQVNLAKALSMHTTTYTRYESGLRDLPMEVAIQIADYYHVSLDYLVGRSEERELR